jgi:competence protein ComEA
MKKLIKIAGIAGLVLAAAVYGLKSSGYLHEDSASGTTAYVSDAAEDPGMSARDAANGVQQGSGADGLETGYPSDAADPQTTAQSADVESLQPAIMVYVCGCVRSPGVYGFDEGARFYEAIEAAGGFTEEAEETYMNLAAYLSDGIKIYVPAVGETTADQAVSGTGQLPAADGTSSSVGMADQGTSDGKIDINTADEDALQTLPGIGPSRAADIVSYRKKNGPFSSIEDIMKVPGIKEAAFSKIRDMIVAR